MGAARKPVLPVIAVCCVLVGWLAWSAVPAFAAAPEAPLIETAESQGSTVVVLKGELNPGGASGNLSYQFDYNTNGTCSVVKGSPEEPPFQQSTPSPSVEVVEGKQDQVTAEAQGLEPNEAYTFCLVATNASNETSLSNEITVQTARQAPSIVGASVANISSTEATISAEIYPHEELASYYVEYGPSNGYGSRTTTVSISAQHGPSGIQARLTGLAPNSEYHYRIVATNSTGSEQAPDATFTTGETSIAGSQGLPDDRTYEMVTPPENENADVYAPYNGSESMYSESAEGIPSSRLFQVSDDGSAVAYEGDATSGGGNGEGGNSLGNQFLARHLPDGGWITHSIQPPGVFSTQYQGFSDDLSVGVLVTGTPAEPTNPPLSTEALGEGYRVLYSRVTSENGYQPLFTNGVPPIRPARAPSGRGWFGTNQAVAESKGHGGSPSFAGGSADFGDRLFEVNDALLPGVGTLETELKDDVRKELAEVEKGGTNLYENDNTYLYDSAGKILSLVDVSPEGKVLPSATFGGVPNDFSGAISADGRRVYWSSLEVILNSEFHTIDRERPTHVYLRENPTEPQSPILNGKCSVPSDACTVPVSEGEAQYWTSAANGRYAFYTEGGGLYRFNAEPEANHAPDEVLVGAGAGVVGVLGAGQDGEDIYFAAKAALVPGATPQTCEGGGCNLYLLDKGKTIFIAGLSGSDENGDWLADLAERTSRVTSNGESLVFMSDQSLDAVGYPHGPPNAGAEVYVYEAGSNSLFCASCGSKREATTGYLPIGKDIIGLPHWISEDGNRVFFDSGSSLVSQDTNSKQDVYEWEREGSGTCTNGSGVNGGCVYLLSGGSSPSDSWLIGASESGNDVFIATRAQLAPEDQNETFDLYDVRVDGVKPVSPPQCTGTGCQGVPAPPPTFATPSSVTFNGVGNFPPPVSIAVKVKAKTRTRAQKLADALKACSKKPKNQRATCDKRARKRYGPSTKPRKRSRTVKGTK